MFRNLLMLGIFLVGVIGCSHNPQQPPPAPSPVVVHPQPPTPLPPPSIGQDDRYVLVGINNYPNAPLNGCINDVDDIKKFLVDILGAKESQIKILKDGEATTVNILAAMDWLTQNAQSGDRRYFHYSGHGAEYVNPDAVNQPNHANQIICPVDFDWSPSRMIMDVQFAKVFKTLPAGVKFNWASDSCFSGDLTRTLFKPKMKVRSYPLPPPDAVKLALSKIKKTNSRDMVNGVLDVGYMSGCKYDQLSADAFIEGRYNGAFTFYLFKVLYKNPTQPLDKVIDEVNDLLKANVFDQEPQVEGARKKIPLLQ